MFIAAQVMMPEADLFLMYRWLLALACTIYAVLYTLRTVWRWLGFFGRSERTALLGRYALVLVLRSRLRRFAWDLVQIVLLLVALGYVVYAHRWITSVS